MAHGCNGTPISSAISQIEPLTVFLQASQGSVSIIGCTVSKKGRRFVKRTEERPSAASALPNNNILAYAKSLIYLVVGQDFNP